jgi:hypothetical protein
MDQGSIDHLDRMAEVHGLDNCHPEQRRKSRAKGDTVLDALALAMRVYHFRRSISDRSRYCTVQL